MKFRDDIDPANTFVVSDTHFGHENIVGYCHRPVDHDQVILERWRQIVPDSATVLHLGDLCYKGNAWFKNVIAPRLTGKRKLLILGNHDRGRPSFYRDCGFKIVKPFAIKHEMYYNDFWGSQYATVEFDHYPWDGSAGTMPSNHWRVHGHIHNNGYYDGRQIGDLNGYVPFLKNHINLSVEQTGYRPVNLKALLDGAVLGITPDPWRRTS